MTAEIQSSAFPSGVGAIVIEKPCFLIVDDNPQDRALAARALRQLYPDARIEEITTQDELADALERRAFHLVVTDYQLNWSDGLMVLREVKGRYPECPVVFYTDSGNEEIAVEALKSGADDYVIKSPRKEQRLAIAARGALERAVLRAREAEALRVRDAFLTVAAHELKTPITGLLGYVHLLQRRIDRGLLQVGETDRKALESITRQTERLRDLVYELLDVSHLLTGAFLPADGAPVDLCRVGRDVVEELRPTLERHTVEITCLSEPLMVLANPMHLERVLQNLLDNAVKYSPAGDSVKVQLQQEGDSALIVVSDRGIGISERDQERIFDRFYRASDTRTDSITGFGVGLYIVQEIVRQYGGTVAVASTPGKGSTFTVRLPLLPQSGPAR